MERARAVAVVVGAGSGTRLGGEIPKALRTIGGRPMVAIAVEHAIASPAIDAVVVVSPPGAEAVVREMMAGVSRPAAIVAGGTTRQRSVSAGLAAAGEAAIVVVHDAARPFASSALFTAVVESVLAGADAAVPVVPLVDTLKRVEGRSVVGTEPREGLMLAQTPQACRLERLRDAIVMAEESQLDFTDDSGVLEWAGAVVHTVEGEPQNIKITTASDLARADELLGAARG